MMQTGKEKTIRKKQPFQTGLDQCLFGMEVTSFTVCENRICASVDGKKDTAEPEPHWCQQTRTRTLKRQKLHEGKPRVESVLLRVVRFSLYFCFCCTAVMVEK